MIEIDNYQEQLKFGFTARMAGLADQKYVSTISEWTYKESKSMLAKTPEEIAKLFWLGKSAIVVNGFGEIVSHAAASFTYPDGAIEFGALVTGEDFKGKGAAILVTKFLLKNLAESNPGSLIFALANPVSSRLFEKLGAVIPEFSKLPKEAFDNCSKCSNNPSPYKDTEQYVFVGCCDTPFDLTDVALSLSHR